MLKSCGSSSSRVRRSHFPTRVIRGSPCCAGVPMWFWESSPLVIDVHRLRFRVDVHGAELEHRERHAEFANALLAENDGAFRIQADGDGREQHERRTENDAKPAKEKREHALIKPQGRAHVKPRRKQQPAQPQRLQRNLSGHGLVVFGTVLDEHSGSFQLQQFAYRQLAAPVAHGDDDAADGLALHELGEIVVLDDRECRRSGGAAHVTRHAQAQLRPQLQWHQ